jgi:hypothetical protein
MAIATRLRHHVSRSRGCQSPNTADMFQGGNLIKVY